MRVALFGGSFNPPHVGHQMAALYVLETQPVDELWFVPCFKHPFEKALESFEDRMKMCALAAAPLGVRARVSDIERTLGGESLTIRTVKALKAEHPQTEFSLIIGSDLEGEKRTWSRADELDRLAGFIVVGRQGHERPGDAVSMPAVSSTTVRERLAAGQNVDQMMSRSVLDYIRQRKLYKGPK